jgi:ubiquitin carboxyl-terminal hydrolase 1
MSLPQVLRAHLQSILTNPLSAQLAPFLVLFLIPCLLLLLFLNINSHYTQRSKSYFLWSAAMVFESLGVGLPWNWTRANGAHHLSSASASSSSSSSVNGHERKKSKKKNIRSREQQLAVANGNARPGKYPLPQQQHSISKLTSYNCCTESSKSNGVDDGYYPGLVNISGTYCFMNSTLQVR